MDPVVRYRPAKFKKFSNFCNRNCSFLYFSFIFRNKNVSQSLVQNGESGRSLELNWTVMAHDSWVKVNGHSTKSGRSFGFNFGIKVDGPLRLIMVLK